MHVLDINNDSILNDVKVVFGVGSVIDGIGYRTLSATDILKDVIFDKGLYDAKQIIEYRLPDLLKQSKQHLPVFYHLRKAGLLAPNGSILAGATVDDRIRDRTKASFASFRNSSYKSKEREFAKLKTKDIISKYDIKHAVIFIPLLKRENIDLGELRDFLREHADHCLSQQPQTDFRKLVCLYDWLEAQSFAGSATPSA
jgi:hypothetical protein